MSGRNSKGYRKGLRHGSLFSGIGGFDLAAENVGWTNVFHCERDEFCQRVLAYHFPNSTPHDDVTTFDGLPYRGRIDVLSGGFPCQPFSHAGERRGAEDDRHLWPEMFRIIQEVRPRWVVGENVRGLTDWNEGMVFDEVLTNLETAGYQVTSFVLPACGQDLPHRRDRIWIVAHLPNARTEGVRCKRENAIYGLEIITNPNQGGLQHGTESRSVGASKGEARPRIADALASDGEDGFATDTTSNRRERQGQSIEVEKGYEEKPESVGKLAGGLEGLRLKRDATDTHGDRLEGSVPTHIHRQQSREEGTAEERVPPHRRRVPPEEFPTQSPICGRDDGLPTELDGITFSKWRAESVKAYGNAVAVPVVEQIFQTIDDYERL